jgi:hypothetical protein
METIVIQCDASDRELLDALAQKFGSEATIVKAQNFSGAEDLVQALVPVVPALLTFLATYFTIKGKRRVVVTSEGNVSLVGYSAKDVEKVIRANKS